MPLIYLFFSLWGLSQLLFCLICWIVVFRYKELISLMYILFISEWLVRLVFYPLIGLGLANNEIYSNGSTPGSYLAPFIVIVLLVLFFLSMKQSKSANSQRIDQRNNLFCGNFLLNKASRPNHCPVGYLKNRKTKIKKGNSEAS